MPGADAASVDGTNRRRGADGAAVPPTDLPHTKAGIGAVLQEGRSRAGLVFRELARRSGVPNGTLQGWIAGRSLPTPALRTQFFGVLDLLGLTDDHTHAEWWAAVERARRAPGTAAGNPYVGLRAYAPEDRDLFFGREDELAELARCVRDAATAGPAGVVTLLAPSGGGKSSLLGAGLVGTACAPGGALEGWYGALITPGDAPESRWLAAYAAREDHPDIAAVLVIDQFEELWTVAGDAQRTALVALLEGVATDAGPATAHPPTVVVVGLRSDYFGLAAEIDVLGPALGHAMLLRPVAAEQAERIITGPARLRGVEVDPGLVAVLQRDLTAGGGPWSGGALPLLSQALTETWDEADGPTLTAADYLAVGGVAGAIDRTAERAYAALAPEERETARELLLRLVRVDLDAPVRRPLELGLLHDERAWTVVDRFARARLLTVGEDTVEIAHEALLRHWSRLRGWVEDDLEDLRAQAYLSRAAALWAEHDRDPELLAPVERFGLGPEEADATPTTTAVTPEVAEAPGAGDGRTGEVRHGRTPGTGDGRTGEADTDGRSRTAERMLGTVERAFVSASRTHFAAREREQQRITRRLRRRSRIAVSAFGVAMALAILAGASLVTVQSTRNEALSRQAALTASLVAAQDPGLSAQVALGADDLATTPEGTSALISATGRPLPRRALGASAPTRLVVDPADRLLAQPGPDGVLRIWHGQAALGAADGDPEAVTLDPQGRTLFSGAVTSVGGRQLLAVGGTEGRWLLDVTATPARVLTTLGEGSGVTYSLAFGRDGRTLYAGMQDGSIRRWDVSTPEAPGELPALPGASAPVRDLAVDRDGTRLAAAGMAGVTRWALDRDQPTALPLLSTTSPVQAVAFSPDGQWLAAGETRSRQVSRWRLDGDAAASQSPLAGFDSWINQVAFSPDGARVVVASSDQTMREFDQSTATQLRSYPHPAVVGAAAYDGDRIVSEASDGTIRWWPLVDPEFAHFPNGLFQMASDPAGAHLVVSVDRVGGIFAWDLTDPAAPRRLSDPQRPAGPAGETPSPMAGIVGDGSAILGGSARGDLMVWQRTGDTFTPPQAIAVDPGHALTWAGTSADGRTLLTSAITSQKGYLLQRSGAGYTITGSIDVDQPQTMAISADGRRAVVADVIGHAGVWTIDDAGRPTLAATLTDLGSVGTSEVFSPDGTYVAIGTDAGRVVVYDLTDPAAPRRVGQTSTALGAIYGLSVSPDGTRLAAGAGDQRIWLWSWRNGELTPGAWIDAALSRVNDVRFVDDGRRLVAIGANGTIASWDVDVTRARQTVCAGRGEPLTAAEWASRLVGARPRELC